MDKNAFTFFRGLTQTHIDVTIVSPDIHTEVEWDTYDDLLSSDHVPIQIKMGQNKTLAGKERWNFKKADWEKFKNFANFEKPIKDFSSIKKLTTYITDTIIKAANQAIIKSKIMNDKISVPWWNDKCKKATKEKIV